MSNFDALSRKEQRAWTAWFNGALQHVTQYESKPDDVFMGKAECEWVPFSEFWLGKVIDLGWMTAEVKGTGVAKGMIGKPKYTEYRLWPTRLGFDIREAELERWKERVTAHEEPAPLHDAENPTNMDMLFKVAKDVRD